MVGPECHRGDLMNDYESCLDTDVETYPDLRWSIQHDVIQFNHYIGDTFLAPHAWDFHDVLAIAQEWRAFVKAEFEFGFDAFPFGEDGPETTFMSDAELTATFWAIVARHPSSRVQSSGNPTELFALYLEGAPA